jgi:hypothetical protein
MPFSTLLTSIHTIFHSVNQVSLRGFILNFLTVEDTHGLSLSGPYGVRIPLHGPTPALQPRSASAQREEERLEN